MTTCFLAPDPIQSTFLIPGGNTVANGGQLFFYAAGSSTKQTVYKDNAAAVAWTNPIVLDSGGNLPSGGEVWFTSGQTYKVIFAPSTDTDPPSSPYWTKDNLAGVNDVAAQTGVEWVSGPTPTFISATQFVLAGDQTGTFTAGRRLKTTNTAGTVYSIISQVTFGSSSTTVNVVSDGSGALDSGLSAVSYGLLDPANPSVAPYEFNRKGANVSSSGNGTTNIWGTVGDYVHITGTNTIAYFSNAPYAGARRELIFDGALTLTHNSPTINLPGQVSVSTAANDRASVRADTVSTFTITYYERQCGAPVPAAAGTGIAVSTNISVSVSSLTNSITSDVLVNNTNNYFDGPSVAQGNVGVWVATGSVLLVDTAASPGVFNIKLWDGTTVQASSRLTTSTNVATPVSLSGVFTSPAGNIRISVLDTSTGSGKILANSSGNVKDSVITVFRIA